MRLPQWAVSVVLAAILTGNVLTIADGTDDWPFSSVPMFHDRFAAWSLPPRVRLIGVRGGVSGPLAAADFGLDPDQLNARILGGPGIARSCGRLGDVFNRRQLPEARLTSLRVRIEFVPRPGVARREPPVNVHCPLAAIDGGAAT